MAMVAETFSTARWHPYDTETLLISSIGITEIGADHFGIGQHVTRRSFSDFEDADPAAA